MRNDSIKFSVIKVILNNGGYDSYGTYFGVGEPLYMATADTDNGYIRKYYRAQSRNGAKSQVIADYQSAKFYR